MLILLSLCLLAASGNAAGCAADNCYNQLSRHSASAFCATYTTAIVTNTAALPTYVSASCGSTRVSSACSCLYPATSTTSTTTSVSSSAAPTATTVTITSVSTVTVSTCSASASSTARVQNGDFPGFYPWFNGDIINESSYGYNPPAITSPGNGGPGYSALFSFDADGIYELDQYVTLPASATTLTLTFYAMSPTATSCFIVAGFGARGQSPYIERQIALSGAWTKYTVQAKTDGQTSGYVALVNQCTGGTNNKIYVDDISLQ